MTVSEGQAPILELRGISKRFVKKLDMAGIIAQKLGVNIREEVVHAVDEVDLTIADGEVVGLVGGPGCGKSTLGAGRRRCARGQRRRCLFSR